MNKQKKWFLMFSNDSTNTFISRTKLEWIDAVRVFATILVVLGHCTYYNIHTPYGGIHYLDTDEVVISKSYFIVSTITKFIYTFHMPLFIIVSGMCFSLSSSRYAKISYLLSNKFSRLIIPFLLVTTFLSVPLKYISGYYVCSDNAIVDILLGQYLLLGNSHLWYVVSLFYIFLFYKLMINLKLHNHIFVWLLLVVFSLVGHKIHSTHYELYGLTGFFKYCLFFSLGFNFVTYFTKSNSTLIKNTSSWLLMFLCWLCLYKNFNILMIIHQFHLRSLFDIMFGIWGSINMIYSCKIISSESNIIQKCCYYNTVLKKSYPIYLYSDPINYIIIFILFHCFGNSLFTSDILPFFSYILRFIGSIVFAIMINRLVKLLSCFKKVIV